MPIKSYLLLSVPSRTQIIFHVSWEEVKKYPSWQMNNTSNCCTNLHHNSGIGAQ